MIELVMRGLKEFRERHQVFPGIPSRLSIGEITRRARDRAGPRAWQDHQAAGFVGSATRRRQLPGRYGCSQNFAPIRPDDRRSISGVERIVK